MGDPEIHWLHWINRNTAVTPELGNASQIASKCFGVAGWKSQNQRKWRNGLVTILPSLLHLQRIGRDNSFSCSKEADGKIASRTAAPRDWWEVIHDFNEMAIFDILFLIRTLTAHHLSQFQGIHFLSPLVSFCSFLSSKASDCRSDSLQSSGNRVIINT